MNNKIVYRRKALKQLRKLPETDSQKIVEGCEALQSFPYCANIKHLTNHKYPYRLRIGNFRVFFEHDSLISIISIEEVKNAMTTLTNVQILNDAAGLPAFAVIPFADYQKLIRQKESHFDDSVPSEVVNFVFVKRYSALRAWREYLGLTQAEVAERMGISQSAYSQHENAEKLTKATRQKIALALGIKPAQLDF